MSAIQKGVAVVTGASSGVGAIYADRLARRGYDLILIARNQKKLDEVARRVSGATGRSVNILAADLNDRAGLQRAERLLSEEAGIAMLVNNAGVGAVAPLLQSKIDAMEEMISLNITALTRLTYAAVPSFVARGGGAVINISSVVGIAPEVLNGVYGATKAFVLAFSLSLHKELMDKNIRVQAVLPGAIATDFWSEAGSSVESLPRETVMQADDVVDAALAGFDLGEIVTIPSLPDVADWNAYEAARQKLMPNLSLRLPAARYRARAVA